MHVSADELQRLFDAVPNVVFFVKDRGGRYTHANLTLVRRLGLKRRGDVIARSAAELFPAPLGDGYGAQDARVLGGDVIEDQLELHLFPNGVAGWCLTGKRPLIERGRVVGLVGLSRDLGTPDERHPTYARLKRVVDHLHERYVDVVRVETLAGLAGLSIAQLERHFRRVFQLTPREMLAKVRIEAAMRGLHGTDGIAAVGAACGYSDQSAFARQFKALTGLTPRQFRMLARGEV